MSGAGGLCVLAGNLAANECMSLNPFALIQGKRIVGTWGGETDPDRDIPMYVHLFLTERLKAAALITHVFGLSEINEALEELEQGSVGRALIDMSC